MIYRSRAYIDVIHDGTVKGLQVTLATHGRSKSLIDVKSLLHSLQAYEHFISARLAPVRAKY